MGRLAAIGFMFLVIAVAVTDYGAAQRPLIQTAPTTADAPNDGRLPELRVERYLVRPMHTFGVTWSPDSKRLATYSNWSDLITVWAADGGILKEIRRGGDHYTGKALAFVGGNSQIAARPVSYRDGGDAVDVYDIATGDVKQKLPGPGRPDQWQPVNAARVLAASPDQSLLAVAFGSGEYHPVALYNTNDWHEVAEIDSPRKLQGDIAQALAFSPDGRFLAVGLVKQVLIFDIRAERIVQTINAETPEDKSCCINAIAFNPDASEIAVANPPSGGFCCCKGDCLIDKHCCTQLPATTSLRIFRVADGARIVDYPGLAAVSDMRWSPDGRFIAFIAPANLFSWFGHGTLYLWNPSHPQERRMISVYADAASLAFAPDGRHIATNDSQYVTIFKIMD